MTDHNDTEPDRTPTVISASTLIGDSIVTPQGDHLGTLKEVMLDVGFGDTEWGADVHRRYGIDPYWEAGSRQPDG